MGTGLMINRSCFSWMVRIVLGVGDSKVSACKLRTLEKGRGLSLRPKNRIRSRDGVMNGQVGKCACSTQRPHD